MVRLQEHETKGAPIRAETQSVQMESSPDRSWDQLQLPHSIEHRASKDVGDVPNFWEGSDWIGTWNSSAVLALPGSDPRLAWQTYYDRLGEAKLDLLLIEPCGPNGLRDFVPDNSYGFITFVEHGCHGRVADLLAGPVLGADSGRPGRVEGTVRSLWGWLGSMEAGEEPLPPCRACGLPTPELCPACF